MAQGAPHRCKPTASMAFVNRPQVDYNSFEGILFELPLLGALLQHGLRRGNSALLIGGARLAAGAWSVAQAALGRHRADQLSAWAGQIWRRQTPRRPWRPLPAPYNPHL